jgi:undecaprenyl-diphosphatase
LIKALFLGIVQGLTEFLPVSGSGHLFFLRRLLGPEVSGRGDLLSFFIFLHLATLFAVFIYLSKYLRLLFSRKLLTQFVIMTFLTGCIGLTVKVALSDLFLNKYFLASCFLANAIILISIRKTTNSRNLESIGIKDAIILGVLQGIAFLPGISRSGITITGLLKRGFKRDESFILSFLMAIPVIVGAFVLESRELLVSEIPLKVLLVGFASAFFSGLFAMAILRKIVISEKFRNFSYYCFAIAILTLII